MASTHTNLKSSFRLTMLGLTLALLALASLPAVSCSDSKTNLRPKKGAIIATADHVSMTKEAAELRSQHLAKKKPLLKQSAETTFTALLFPGSTPEEYTTGDPIPVFVELVESRKTQLPVNYFQIPGVCSEPSKEEMNSSFSGNNAVNIKRKNLGQRLMSSTGTKLVAYKINTKESSSCTPLCQSTIPSKKLKFLKRLIDKQYRVHFTLDSLPIVVRSKSHNYALRGFPVGFKDVGTDGSDQYFIYNHLRFIIYYNDNSEGDNTLHVTGFDVVPVSVQQDMEQCTLMQETLQNKKDNFLQLKTDKAGNPMDILYSYEVQWVPSEIQWADRWDIYMMETPDNEVHYFAIVNSLMIGLLLTGVVAVIMLRALRKDIAHYNDLGDDVMEESGWKLVHGDVFRPPVRGRTLLSVSVGTGLQIGTSVFFTLVAAAFRLLNPMWKGQTLSYVVVLYVLSGSVAGYFSARLYKFFCGKAWKRTTLMTAAAFPGVLFAVFVALNFFLYLSLGKASSAVSFWTILLMFLLWVCVSAPLVFIGAFFGYKADKIEVPTKTTQIARFVPETNSWFVKFPHCALMAGILPFASVCIELSFIMNALWINQIYYIMGFITVVCFVFTLAVSTMSMVMCYCQLCNEDYKWWWKSFFNGASTGVYLFIYSLWYLVAKLELVGLLSLVVYISYMGLICFAFALYCGGVGLISSFWFCRKIYAALKVD